MFLDKNNVPVLTFGGVMSPAGIVSMVKGILRSQHHVTVGMKNCSINYYGAAFLQMLYRVFAYLDVKMVSQTFCKVVSANLVVTILTDTVCELFDIMAKFVS